MQNSENVPSSQFHPSQINIAGVIEPGDVDCQHYMIVSEPCDGRHEIGRCRKCGRTVDYTVLRGKLGWTAIYGGENYEPEQG